MVEFLLNIVVDLKKKSFFFKPLKAFDGFHWNQLVFHFFFNLKIFEKFWRFHSKNEVEND